MRSPSTDRPLSRRAALAAGVAAASALAGCSTVEGIRQDLSPHTHHSDAELGDPPEPWPTKGGSARRTAARPTAPDIGDDPTVERVGPGGGEFRDHPPAVDGEAVYATTLTRDDGVETRGFVATGRNGDARWEINWESRELPATPTIHGETALLSRAGKTIAVDRRTAERRWEYAAGTDQSVPTAVGETVYLPGKRLLALDGVTGERRWRADDVPTHATPVSATEDAVVTASDGALYAVEPDDGSVRWEVELAQGSYVAPVVGEEVIVVAGSDGLVQAHARSDGTERWTNSVAGNQRAVAVADGAVYAISDTNDRLLAFDAVTGERRWTADLGPTVDHQPAVGGETAYAMGYDERKEEDALFCVDAESGGVDRTVPLRTADDEPLEIRGSGVALADDGVLFPAGVRGEYGIYRLG